MVDNALQKNEKFTVRDTLNDEDVELQVDPKSRAQVTIDFEHHKLHGGELFRAFTVKDVGNAGTLILGIVTEDEEATLKEVHFRFTVKTEGEALIDFYEMVTAVTGGTVLPLNNANRRSLAAAFTDITKDPTLTLGTPTKLMEDHLGSGHQVGGSIESDNEWILKRNANYAIVVTNLTTLNNHTAVEIVLYEHEPYF